MTLYTTDYLEYYLTLVSWVVQNASLFDAVSTWTDAVWLSQQSKSDPSTSEGDLILVSQPAVVTPLGGGDAYNAERSVTLPLGGTFEEGP